MKTEVMQRLNAILNALDTISVSGRKDVMSMYGVMSVLEETIQIISKADSELLNNNEPQK